MPKRVVFLFSTYLAKWIVASGFVVLHFRRTDGMRKSDKSEKGRK